jgi:excinuclease UvrABC nuclease subunit
MLKSEGEILLMAQPRPRRCGVYFLIENCKIVYVGQSIGIDARIGQHHADKMFSHVAYIECAQEQLNTLEALYINKFDPTLNIISASNARIDSAAAYKLLVDTEPMELTADENGA